MAKNKHSLKQDGTIVEALSNAMFKVKLENGHEDSGNHFRQDEDAFTSVFCRATGWVGDESG